MHCLIDQHSNSCKLWFCAMLYITFYAIFILNNFFIIFQSKSYPNMWKSLWLNTKSNSIPVIILVLYLLKSILSNIWYAPRTLWSQNEITDSLELFAFSSNCSTVNCPSEQVVCICKSILLLSSFNFYCNIHHCKCLLSHFLYP